MDRPAIGAALALLVAGCGRGGLGPSEALELASPHAEHFSGFDRWARRALAADPAFRSEATLEETLFAPVRREDAVLAVWIDRDNPERHLVFGHLEEPPKHVTWARVRHEGLGEIDVTTSKVPDPRRRVREGEAQGAVLVRRTGPGPDGANVVVTVAYRVDGDG